MTKVRKYELKLMRKCYGISDNIVNFQVHISINHNVKNIKKN